LAARAFGVGVLQFSIGFGPKLAGFRRGETEYLIKALPLGGYVRMLGMEPGEAAELPEEEKKKALWAKPIWQRFLIVLAGPVANLILPLPIFIAVYASVEGRVPAQVGTVVADSPAERAGLESGDEILAIDGHQVDYFDQLQDLIGGAQGRQVELQIRRRDEELTVALEPEVIWSRDPWVRIRTMERAVIGVTATVESPVVQVSDPDSPGARAGLRTFDRVVRFDGEPVRSLIHLEGLIERAHGPFELVVMRPTPLGGGVGDLFVERPEPVTVDPGDARRLDDLGLSPAGMVVYSVQPGSPADAAGLRRGDEILLVDGRRYNVFTSMLARLMNKPGQAHEIVFRRDGVEQTGSLTPVELDVTGDFNQELSETFVGMRSLTAADAYPHAFEAFPLVDMSFFERVAYGLRMGFEALFGFILGIVVGVWQLIVGEVGLSNLGGPIMIFDIAGRAGSAGAEPFLRIMALISINLGILNLLPIPVLDGGNLMLFTIEAVKRGPITQRTRQIATYVGLAMIMMLFLLVFKNDIERYWENFAEFFE
jgi:regulator of sigma E protease